MQMQELSFYIPPQVEKLAERERQVATIIYKRGACTAKQVEAQLSPHITNGAVRSMLVRLVTKGILKRQHGRRGRGQEFVYSPRITPAHVKLVTLKELANQHFEGSLFDLAVMALELLNAPAGTTSSPPHSKARHRKTRRQSSLSPVQSDREFGGLVRQADQ